MTTRRGRRVDRELIRRVGRPCTWEQAIKCPNIDEYGAHKHTCSSCDPDSRGYLYAPPVSTHFLFLSDDRKEDFNMSGAWEKGDARCSMPANFDVGIEDRIIPQNDPVRDNLILTRGASAEGQDIIRSPHVIELLRVQSISRTFVRNVDYKLVQNAAGQWTVDWSLGGTEPVAGENYSILFDCNPVWIASSHAMIRAFGPNKSDQLPKRVNLRRYDASVVRSDT